MKAFLTSLALWSAAGASVALSFSLFAAWQACVLILLALIAFVIFRIKDGLLTFTRKDDRVLSRQLSNLYVLLAWKGVPVTDLESAQAPARSEKLLSAWERLNRLRSLGDGMTLEEADSAAFAKFQEQSRLIAALTPDRIEDGCNKRSSFSDPEPGPGLPKKALCPKCAEAYAEAKQRWAEVLAAEETGKSLRPHEYPVRHPLPHCSLPRIDGAQGYGRLVRHMRVRVSETRLKSSRLPTRRGRARYDP
jgi:hypothetical protein